MDIKKSIEIIVLDLLYLMTTFRLFSIVSN